MAQNTEWSTLIANHGTPDQRALWTVPTYRWADRHQTLERKFQHDLGHDATLVWQHANTLLRTTRVEVVATLHGVK